MKEALEKYVAENTPSKCNQNNGRDTQLKMGSQQATFGQPNQLHQQIQGNYASLPSSIMNVDEQPSQACGVNLSNYFSSTLRESGNLNCSRSRAIDNQLAIPKPSIGTDPPKVITVCTGAGMRVHNNQKHHVADQNDDEIIDSDYDVQDEDANLSSDGSADLKALQPTKLLHVSGMICQKKKHENINAQQESATQGGISTEYSQIQMQAPPNSSSFLHLQLRNRRKSEDFARHNRQAIAPAKFKQQSTQLHLTPSNSSQTVAVQAHHQTAGAVAANGQQIQHNHHKQNSQQSSSSLIQSNILNPRERYSQSSDFILRLPKKHQVSPEAEKDVANIEDSDDEEENEDVLEIRMAYRRFKEQQQLQQMQQNQDILNEIQQHGGNPTANCQVNSMHQQKTYPQDKRKAPIRQAGFLQQQSSESRGQNRSLYQHKATAMTQNQTNRRKRSTTFGNSNAIVTGGAFLMKRPQSSASTSANHGHVSQPSTSSQQLIHNNHQKAPQKMTQYAAQQPKQRSINHSNLSIKEEFLQLYENHIKQQKLKSKQQQQCSSNNKVKNSANTAATTSNNKVHQQHQNYQDQQSQMKTPMRSSQYYVTSSNLTTITKSNYNQNKFNQNQQMMPQQMLQQQNAIQLHQPSSSINSLQQSVMVSAGRKRGISGEGISATGGSPIASKSVNSAVGGDLQPKENDVFSATPLENSRGGHSSRPASIMLEEKKFEEQTRKYVENSAVLVNKNQKIMANARFTSQGGLPGSKKGNVGIKGALVDTGLRLDQSGKSSAISSNNDQMQLSNLSFYERQRKQKELKDQLVVLQRYEKEQLKEEITSQGHHSSPPLKRRHEPVVQANENAGRKSPQNGQIGRKFKKLHEDIVTRPLEASVKRLEEAESKRIFEELLEKERHYQEHEQRKNFYQKMRKTTYSKELAKLDRSPSESNKTPLYMQSGQKRGDQNNSDWSQSGKKTTFRKQIFQEELSIRPLIGKNTHKYLKRHKSTGNICLDLYQDSFIRNQRKNSTEKEKWASLRNMSNQSVLENAGIVKVGANQVRNSDRYLALKLSREFDQVVKSISSISEDQKVDKSLLFDILVQLMMLKSLDDQNSEFIQQENMQLFQSVWSKLTGQADFDQDEGSVNLDLEKVRFFFLNMHYLWGDWLARDQLMAHENRPDLHKKEPQIMNPSVLHSVPLVVISRKSLRNSWRQQDSKPYSKLDHAAILPKSLEINAETGGNYQSQGFGGQGYILSSERFHHQNSEVNISHQSHSAENHKNNQDNQNTTSAKKNVTNNSTLNISHQTMTNDDFRKQQKSDFAMQNLGVRSEFECRKLIKDYNLLNVNRQHIQTQLTKLDQQNKSDQQIGAHLQDRPSVSAVSTKLASNSRKRRQSQEKLIAACISSNKTPLLELMKNQKSEEKKLQSITELQTKMQAAPFSLPNNMKTKSTTSAAAPSLKHHKKSNSVSSMQTKQNQVCSSTSTPQIVKTITDCSTFNQPTNAQENNVSITRHIKTKSTSPLKSSQSQKPLQQLCLSNKNTDKNIHEELQGIEIGHRLHQKDIKAHQTGLGKSKDQVEFEKNKKEMTFKPKILNKPTPYRQPIVLTQKAKMKHENEKLRQEYRKLLFLPQDTNIENNKSLKIQAQSSANSSSNGQSKTKKNVQIQKQQQNARQFIYNDQDIHLIDDLTVQTANIRSHQQKHQVQQENNYDLQQVDDDQGDDPPPRLYLDVNLGNGTRAKLMIFEGEDVETVVESFSAENRLSVKKKSKLLAIIQNQLALPKVTEVEDENLKSTGTAIIAFPHGQQDMKQLSNRSQAMTTQETIAQQPN